MGWGIRELGEAIRQSIAWEAMPEVNSPKLFEKVKQFLLDEKGRGRLLAIEKDLYRDFCAGIRRKRPLTFARRSKPA